MSKVIYTFNFKGTVSQKSNERLYPGWRITNLKNILSELQEKKRFQNCPISTNFGQKIQNFLNPNLISKIVWNGKKPISYYCPYRKATT